MEENQTILHYVDVHGSSFEVHFIKDDIWLSQRALSVLFGLNIRTVSDHIGRIYLQGELKKSDTIRNLRIVQNEGTHQVSREIRHYSNRLALVLRRHIRHTACPEYFIWAQDILKSGSPPKMPESGQAGLLVPLQQAVLDSDGITLPAWDEIVTYLLENKIGQLTMFHRGECLYRQGERAVFVTLLLTGKTKVVYVTAAGKCFVQRIFDAGVIIGVVPLLLNSYHESSCEAILDTQTIRIGMDDFRLLLRQNAEFTQLIMKQLSFSVRYYAWTSRILSNPDIKSRVMECMQRIAYEYGEKQADGSIKIGLKLTQETIAEMIGASRQNVSIQIHRLKQQGVLRVSQSSILIEKPWF
ncbi:MAG: helix-turn-helix domain-containing protein [Clostridia bacterium]